ncbi:WxL domain-containing protein [Levilactobacillus angrenensis]|uniref:WxL domain-containing protein n=1 Tax=Levilactobacillus angrenensis TaxID=2486020 RepID=A0ABW1UCU4_9LACO|nr:WxL domain-containing protein [Levilactobacillus angrenensis]
MTRWTALIVTSLALTALVLSGSTAAAASARTPNGDQTTTAKVTLKGGDTSGAVAPQDPDGSGNAFPGDDLDPSNHGTGSTGDLTIDYASNLVFDENSYANGVITATATNHQAFVQVSDRRYTGDGWQLMLTPSVLVGQSNSAKIDGSDASVELGVTKFLASGATVSKYPHVTTTSTTRLPLGEMAKVGQADYGTGLGTWIYRLNYDTTAPTKLLVNGSAVTATQTYTGVLNWTLTDSLH